MAITTKEVEEFEIGGIEALAAMIQGQSRGDVVQEEEKPRVISFRLDPSLISELQGFADKAGISRNAVVEMLLLSGIRQVKEMMKLNEEMYDLPEKGGKEE